MISIKKTPLLFSMIDGYAAMAFSKDLGYKKKHTQKKKLKCCVYGLHNPIIFRGWIILTHIHLFTILKFKSLFYHNFIPGFPMSFQLQRYWSNIRWSAFQSLGEWRNQFRFLLFQYRIIAHPLGWPNGRIPLRFDKQSLGRVVKGCWRRLVHPELHCRVSRCFCCLSSRNHRGFKFFGPFRIKVFSSFQFCAQFPSLVSKSLLNEKKKSKKNISTDSPSLSSQKKNIKITP